MVVAVSVLDYPLNSFNVELAPDAAVATVTVGDVRPGAPPVQFHFARSALCLLTLLST